MVVHAIRHKYHERICPRRMLEQSFLPPAFNAFVDDERASLAQQVFYFLMHAMGDNHQRMVRHSTITSETFQCLRTLVLMRSVSTIMAHVGMRNQTISL